MDFFIQNKKTVTKRWALSIIVPFWKKRYLHELHFYGYMYVMCCWIKTPSLYASWCFWDRGGIHFMLKIQLSLQIFMAFHWNATLCKGLLFYSWAHSDCSCYCNNCILLFLHWRSVYGWFLKNIVKVFHTTFLKTRWHLVMLRSNKHLMTLNLFTLVWPG